METKIIAKFENAEYGIEAVVAQIASGFSVAIRDTEANEFYPMAKIYKTVEVALAEAQKAAA